MSATLQPWQALADLAFASLNHLELLQLAAELNRQVPVITAPRPLPATMRDWWNTPVLKENKIEGPTSERVLAALHSGPPQPMQSAIDLIEQGHTDIR